MIIGIFSAFVAKISVISQDFANHHNLLRGNTLNTFLLQNLSELTLTNSKIDRQNCFHVLTKLRSFWDVKLKGKYILQGSQPYHKS